MTAKDCYARCRQETSVQKRKRYLVNTERERERERERDNVK